MGDELRRSSARRASGGEATGVPDKHVLRRAAQVNEALAWEFHRPGERPLANPAIRQIEALGVEACGLAEVGLDARRGFASMWLMDWNSRRAALSARRSSKSHQRWSGLRSASSQAAVAASVPIGPC
jgi:hypothetical protein